MILSRPLALRFLYRACVYAGGNRLSNVPTMNTIPLGKNVLKRKKILFSPLHPHVEPIFSSTVALLPLEEKLVLHAGGEGEKILFIISKHFKNFAGFTIMLKDEKKH